MTLGVSRTCYDGGMTASLPQTTYLAWHYGTQATLIRMVFSNLAEFGWYYFSVPFLVRTLFSPWKRVIRVKRKPGFSFEELGDIISYNVVSRVIGFMVRSVTILTGCLLTLAFMVLGLLALILWYVTPGIWYPFYLRTTRPPLWKRVLDQPNDQTALSLILRSPFGQFLQARTTVTEQEMLGAISTNQELKFIGTKDMIEHWVPAYFLYLFLHNPQLRALFDHVTVRDEDMQFLINWFRAYESTYLIRKPFWDRDTLLHIPSIGRDWVYGFTPTLESMTIDLSMTPIPFGHFHGRKREFESIEKTLLKQSANNIILVGEAGVGKQPLLIHFAHEIAAGRVYPELKNKRVLYLEFERLFTGNYDSTQRKSILTYVLDEAHLAGNVILVVDHFDRFISEGTDRMDLSDIFAHHMSNSQFRLIAAVTPDEYHQYIETNGTIMHYFEKIDVLPVGKSETLGIITDILPSFETGKIFFLYQSLREVVDIADRYLREKPFPDSAINILDEVSTGVSSQSGLTIVTPEDVRSSISHRLKIPMTLTENEKTVLLNLESELHKRIISQDDAVSSVARALRRNRADITAKKGKPIGSFLFLGPTGVGKTETAKALAELMFGNESHMARFDMSEFQEEEAVKRFLGDFNRGKVGVFTSKIRETPFTVVLLDEFEKANPKLLTVFLAALDEGYVSDAFGKKVYLDHTIIIATSNGGAEFIRQSVQSRPDIPQDVLHRQVLEYVQANHIFAPELINRFDAVIVFHPLTRAHAEEIFNVYLARFNRNLQNTRGITLRLTDERKALILKEGFDPIYGGRALSRAFQKYIEDPLSQEILKNTVRKGDTVEM